MKRLLEIAAFSLEAATMAAVAGASRIELCVDYAAGGLTPPPEVLTAVLNAVACPVFVMIRPKPGGFVYTEEEVQQMKADLLRAKKSGAQGFVFGILQEDCAIDETVCRELVALASPLPCTFHRAFDDLEDKPAALEQLIRCGFQRVLTSGGPGGAASHAARLKSLIAQAAGRIIVMPGGGIRPENLDELITITAAREYHSAAITGHLALPDSQAIAAMARSLDTRSSTGG